MPLLTQSQTKSKKNNIRKCLFNQSAKKQKVEEDKIIKDKIDFNIKFLRSQLQQLEENDWLYSSLNKLFK